MSTSPHFLMIGNTWFPTKPGGLDRYVYELLQIFKTLDLSLELLGIDLPDQSSESSITFDSIGSAEDGLIKRVWNGYCQIKKLHEQDHPPNVINIHFAPYGLVVFLKSRLNIPVVMTFHGPWALESKIEGGSRMSTWFKRQIELFVYRRCDRFITLSQAFADLLNEEYNVPHTKIHTIPGGIDTAIFDQTMTRRMARERLAFPQNRSILFTPRRLVHRVGIDKLLRALLTVKQQVPDVWLAIAGKGPQRETLEQQAQDLGLSDNVKFLGYVPDEDLPICYQAADLTVVPSQSLEGFGLILLESLASGTPVLSTPVGGMPEVLCPFDENLVTRDSSVEAISDRLVQFLTGELTLPNRETCRSYAVENYDWATIASQVKEVLLMHEFS